VWMCENVSRNDSCGSKTRNGKLGGPKRERGVLNCSKSIPRGYGMSSSTKAAVEAKRGLEICLIWVKMRNANSSRPERERRAWKCSKSVPGNYERVSSVKTLAETKWVVKSLRDRPQRGQNAKTRNRGTTNVSGGSETIRNRFLSNTKRYRGR